jgi:hypothetical protein
VVTLIFFYEFIFPNRLLGSGTFNHNQTREKVEKIPAIIKTGLYPNLSARNPASKPVRIKGALIMFVRATKMGLFSSSHNSTTIAKRDKL